MCFFNIVQLSFFFYFICFNCHYLRNLCTIQDHKDLLLYFYFYVNSKESSFILLHWISTCPSTICCKDYSFTLNCLDLSNQFFNSSHLVMKIIGFASLTSLLFEGSMLVMNLFLWICLLPYQASSCVLSPKSWPCQMEAIASTQFFLLQH